MGNIDNARELASRMTKETLKIPNIRSAFQKWPSARNQYLPSLRKEVDQILRRNIQDAKKRQLLTSCDFGLLTSCLYPDANWAELQTASAFMLWIFTWDDEIDDAGTFVAQSQTNASEYCQKSVEYTRLALGLDSKNVSTQDDYEVFDVPCEIEAMLCFKIACEAFRVEYDCDQRNRLFKEMSSFMMWANKEQITRESGDIITPESYFEMRNWTSAIYPALAIYEYIAQVRLGEEIMECEDMRVVWKETTYLCMLINDIYSCQKELKCASVLNAVPVLFYAQGATDINKAIDDIVQMMVASVDNCDQAANRLAPLDPNMARYLDVFRTTVTGLLEWTLQSPRYGLSRYEIEGGKMVINLSTLNDAPTSETWVEA